MTEKKILFTATIQTLIDASSVVWGLEPEATAEQCLETAKSLYLEADGSLNADGIEAIHFVTADPDPEKTQTSGSLYIIEATRDEEPTP